MRAIRCRSCSEVQAPAFFCRNCDAIQALPQDTDYLAVLGLPPHPVVDVAELDRRYYELSRKLHPDRYQTRGAEEQREDQACDGETARAGGGESGMCAHGEGG